MTRQIKNLGVAALAVVALAAAVASVASAASYTASTYPTTVTAEGALGNSTLTTEAGKVECKTHYEGTLAATSSSLTIKVKHTNCKAFGFLEATVNTGSCDYLYTQPTGGPNDQYVAPVDVKCTNAASPITASAGSCKFTIGEQSLTGQVSFTDNTAEGDVFAKGNLTGIKYTVTEDGFGCPFGGTGAKTGASWVEHSSVTFDSTNGATFDIA